MFESLWSCTTCLACSGHQCDEDNTHLQSPPVCVQHLDGLADDRCLTDDADAHAHAEHTPPPLSALREYSSKLQAQLQEVSCHKYNLLHLQK